MLLLPLAQMSECIVAALRSAWKQRSAAPVHSRIFAVTSPSDPSVATTASVLVAELRDQYHDDIHPDPFAALIQSVSAVCKSASSRAQKLLRALVKQASWPLGPCGREQDGLNRACYSSVRYVPKTRELLFLRSSSHKADQLDAPVLGQADDLASQK